MTQNTYAYHKKYRYDRDHGVKRMADAGPIRLHIASCVGFGMSRRSIAAEAGVSPQVVQGIWNGQKTCKPHIAQAVLSVRPGIARKATKDASEPFVPKLGAVRRIQALLAMGYPHHAQHAVCGIRTHLITSQPGQWVVLSTFEAIERMYREFASRPGPSNRTRTRARILGYPSPAMWDDIDMDDAPDLLDVPAEVEPDIDEVKVQRVLSGRSEECTKAERAEIIARTEAGATTWRQLEVTTGWNVHRERKAA